MKENGQNRKLRSCCIIAEQHLGLNFPSVFKEYFQPEFTMFQNEKQTLFNSMNLLLDDMKLVITNEWQAATLRLEVAVEKMMRESYVRLVESAQAIRERLGIQ